MPSLGYFPLLGILTLRYLAIAGGAFAYFWVWKRDKLAARRIQDREPQPGIHRQEFLWSMATSLIFAGAGKLVVGAQELGLTRFYENIDDYGWIYFFLSVPILMILHDTYFYWTHRWMHSRLLFNSFHRVHHESRVPSPLAAFSFHPLEALVEAAILPALVMIVPVHPAALLIFLFLMTGISVINHLGFELYPQGFGTKGISKWLISATHHDFHHQSYGHNLGLYFTWWDRWMGTQRDPISMPRPMSSVLDRMKAA